MRVDGKAYQVSDDAPVGLLGPGGRQAAPAVGVRAPDLRMSVRAGIVVTGTEVLSAIIADRNGPWLSERLRERGVELAHIVVVADRPDDVRAALEFLAGEGVDLILTTGGLGPTADDLTAEVVGAFAGRADGARPGAGGADPRDPAPQPRPLALLQRGGDAGGQPQAGGDPARRDDPRAGRDRARPRRRAATAGRSSSCCRDRPASCGRCGPWRSTTPPLRALLARAGTLESRMLRLYGVPESEIAQSLLAIEDGGVRARPARDHDLPAPRRDRDRHRLRARPPSRCTTRSSTGSARATATRCSPRTARRSTRRSRRLLGGRTIAVAESCTGGLMAGAPDRPRGLERLRARRRRRVLQRGEGRVRRRAGGADRAPRRGLARGRGRARRRRRRALRRRRRHRDHRGRRTRRRDAGEAGRDGLPQRRARRAAGGSTAPCSCPATARWCASAPRRSSMHLLRRLLA